jgi:hypothetical protein
LLFSLWSGHISNFVSHLFVCKKCEFFLIF